MCYLAEVKLQVVFDKQSEGYYKELARNAMERCGRNITLYAINFFLKVEVASHVVQHYIYSQNLRIYIHTFIYTLCFEVCYLAVVILHMAGDQQGEGKGKELELNGIVLRV